MLEQEKRNCEELFNAAKELFRRKNSTLSARTTDSLTREDHTEFALHTDRVFAQIIKEYLPQFIGYCSSASDIIESLCGMALIQSEEKQIRQDFIPFFAQGISVAIFLCETPTQVEKILASVGKNGYPNAEIVKTHFLGKNEPSKTITCAGILSTMALFETLLRNPEKTSAIARKTKLLDSNDGLG